MKKSTKIFSLVLCIIMCVSMLPTSSFAADVGSGTTATTDAYAIATLIASDEDSSTFAIPLNDSTSRSLYNLEVKLTGDKVNHTVTATLTNTIALGFSTIDVELSLYSDRYATVLRDSAWDNDLNIFESISAVHTNVKETAIYYATVTGVANGQQINYITYLIPFNSLGEKYPMELKSPVTGASLPYNIPVTAAEIPVSQWVPWNPTTRGNYETYLGKDLTGYDVHHILPRRYGGTNSPSNLIPLTKSDHTRVTNWWKYY